MLSTHINFSFIVDTDNFSPSSNHKRTASLQNEDPYSALRAHHEEQQFKHQQMVTAIMSTTRQVSSSTSSSSIASHDSRTQQESIDPYAALRQLSEGSTEPPTLAILPSSSSTWSSPKAQPHQSYLEPNHVALWQGKTKASEKPSFLCASLTSPPLEKLQSTATDEWVEAEPYEPEDDEDEDMMTQSSSTTAHSTNSSIKSHIANQVNVFSDLDPLASYKRNKGYNTSTTQPNLI